MRAPPPSPTILKGVRVDVAVKTGTRVERIVTPVECRRQAQGSAGVTVAEPRAELNRIRSTPDAAAQRQAIGQVTGSARPKLSASMLNNGSSR